MNVFIVYCHPSEESFTFKVKEAFVKGITDAGHSYVISDLYAMGFQPVFSEQEYKREAFYAEAEDVPADVHAEQAKINAADVLVLIYPDFWTEAPAMLVGWFQRVLTYGYAYGEKKMKPLEKALFFVTMGGSLQEEIRVKQVDAMKTVMIGDRMNGRANHCEMIVFDQMTRGYGNDGKRAENTEKFLRKAYEIGATLAGNRADSLV